MSKRIVLVGPAGSSPAHGIIDQMRLLQQALRARDIDASVVVVRAPHSLEPHGVVEGETQVPLRRALSTVGLQDTLWLHWANYGLSVSHKTGVPAALLIQLLARQRRQPSGRFLLSVHEGWDRPATVTTWRWPRMLAQRAATRLAAVAADRVVVNCDRWRLGLTDRIDDITQIDSPSNFMPVEGGLARRDKRGDIAVMGGEAERRRLLAKLASLSNLLPGVSLDAEVHEIGHGAVGMDSIGGMTVRHHGFVQASEMQGILETCSVGVLDIDNDVLGKSTISSTYNIFGLSVLNLSNRPVTLTPPTRPGGGIADLVSWAING